MHKTHKKKNESRKSRRWEENGRGVRKVMVSVITLQSMAGREVNHRTRSKDQKTVFFKLSFKTVNSHYVKDAETIIS